MVKKKIEVMLDADERAFIKGHLEGGAEKLPNTVAGRKKMAAAMKKLAKAMA